MEFKEIAWQIIETLAYGFVLVLFTGLTWFIWTYEDDQKMKHFGTDTYKTYQVKQFIRKFLVILVLGVIVQYFVSLEN